MTRVLLAALFLVSGIRGAAAFDLEGDRWGASRIAFKFRINGVACANSINHRAMEWIRNKVEWDLTNPANPFLWATLAAYRLREIEIDDRWQDDATLEHNAERAVSLGPSLWETHWMLAKVRLHQRRFALAEILIDKALALGADNTAIAFIRAEMAVQKRQPKLAEDELLTVKSMGNRGFINGEVISANLGTALVMQGRHQEAVTAYKGAEMSYGLPGACQYIALHGQASTLLLHIGDPEAAAPIIERGGSLADNGAMQRLRSLLPYVKWLNGAALDRAPLTPDEAALELVKWPVGAKAIPKLIREMRLRNLESLDGQGNSLLILAAAANQADVADALIKAGANVNRGNRQGQRALGYFASNGNEAGISALLAAGAEIAYRDKRSTTPLAAAVESGNFAALQLLLARAGVAARPELDGLLVAAAYVGKLESAKILVAAGARINAGDGKSMPALVAGVLSANREIVKWLLANKADPDIRFMGRAAIDYARVSPDPEIRRMFVGGGNA